MNAPLRERSWPIYELNISETYGKREPNPLEASLDHDVLVEVELSRLRVLLEDALRLGATDNDRDQLNRYEERHFANSRGREIALSRHLTEMLYDFSKEHEQLLREAGVFLGVGSNFAPRFTNIAENGGIQVTAHDAHQLGGQFTIVDAKSPLRIVATPLEAVAVSDLIQESTSVQPIPNLDNGIWKNNTQHRSAHAFNALQRGKYEFPSVSPADIDVKDHESGIEFVDTYGNIITTIREGARVAAGVVQRASEDNRQIWITVNGVTLPAFAALSLNDAQPGEIAAYVNGGKLDIVWKWTKTSVETGNTNAESAFTKFDQPREFYDDVEIHLEDPAISS